MMSAKSLVTESCPVAPSPATVPQATAEPGVDSTNFATLLTGSAPGVDLSLAPGLPAQAFTQLLANKPGLKAAPLPTGTAPSRPAEVPGDILELLSDSGALLAAETPQTGEVEKPDVHIEPEEAKAGDEDILSEWMAAMIPSGVFAAQAGSQQRSGDNASAGDAAKRGPTANPISLSAQAGLLADVATGNAQNPVATTVDPSAQIMNNATAARELAASAATTAAALAPAPASEKKDETREDNANWMNALNSVTSGRAHEIARDTQTLATPVHDSRWADALAHRLVMMAREGESVAQLRLVPQDLGPLDIQISVRDGEASVHFGAANAETRAVLEASMPRLREMLSAQGLQLTNSSVSHHSGGQPRSERSAGNAPLGTVEESERDSVKAVSTSLLDIYA